MRQLDPNRAERIRSLAETHTPSQIAKELGRNVSSIVSYLRTNKIAYVSHKAGVALEYDQLRQQAALESFELAKDPFFCLGLALYWGEGDKSGHPGITNGDMSVLKIGKRWLEKYLNIASSSFRCKLQLHIGKDEQQALFYWCSELGLTDDQFYKTLWKSSDGSNDSCPRGIVTLLVPHKSNLCKILGWLDGIKTIHK